jgi:hypothetical protein
VIEELGDHRDIGTCGDQQRGVGVPQTVEGQFWQRFTLHAEFLEQLGDIRRVERVPVFHREDVAVGLPGFLGVLPLLSLSQLPGQESSYGGIAQRHCTKPGLGLGARLDDLTLNDYPVTPYDDHALGEVNVEFLLTCQTGVCPWAIARLSPALRLFSFFSGVLATRRDLISRLPNRVSPRALKVRQNETRPSREVRMPGY